MLSLGTTRRFVRGTHSSGRRPSEWRCECRCECRLHPSGITCGLPWPPGASGVLTASGAHAREVPPVTAIIPSTGAGRPWGRLGAPSSAPPGAPPGAPVWRTRRTRSQRIAGPCERELARDGGVCRSTPDGTGRSGGRAAGERGRRTRHRTHATLPDEKVGAYGRDMRRPWTTSCLRPGLRARLTVSTMRPDDGIEAGPVGPLVAGGRRCRLQLGYAPPKGPHRAPTHPSPTDRRRAAVRAAPGERDGRPETPWMPAPSEPGA